MTNLLRPALTLCGLLVLALPAHAASVSNADPATPMVPFAEEDYSGLASISPGEHVDISIASDALRARPESQVAGVWLDESTREVIVGIGSGVDQGAFARELRTRGVDRFRLKVAEHSQADLRRVLREISADASMDFVSSGYVDFPSNKVIVTSSVPVTEEMRSRLYSSYGEAVSISPDPTTFGTFSREADYSPFYAGAWLTRHYETNIYCTLGFSWVGGGGYPRMLSAGHCYPGGGGPNAAWTDYGVGTGTYGVGVTFKTTFTWGVGATSGFGDLTLLNTNKDGDGLVTGRSGAPRMWTGDGHSTTSTAILSVDKWANWSDRVCYSGAWQGTQCGSNDVSDGGYSVTQLYAFYETSSGEVFEDIVRAWKDWGVCARPGESGAPVYVDTPGVGVAAHGILSGGPSGFDYFAEEGSSQDCYFFYTEVGHAYDAWSGNVEVAS